MDELQRATLQVVFEHFRFNGFYSSSAPSWTFAKHLSTLDPADINRHTRTGLLIESGFSFTHVVFIALLYGRSSQSSMAVWCWMLCGA